MANAQSNNNQSNADLMAEIARLKAENEQMKSEQVARKSRNLYCKVSQKGAVSVYGLGRMPVTLYDGQWGRLEAFMPEVKQFRIDHQSELSQKPPKGEAAPEAAEQVA